jgi:putative endonuclease
MYFVYAIYNRENDKIYIGQTNNLEQRLVLHNSKTFNTSYTARFSGDWILIYKEKIANRPEALIREKQFKSFRGREFIRQLVEKQSPVAQW